MKSNRGKSMGPSGSSNLPPTNKNSSNIQQQSQLTSPKVGVGVHLRNGSQIQKNSSSVLQQSNSSQNVAQLSGRGPQVKKENHDQNAAPKDIMYKAFRSEEDDKISRSSVLMAKVFYMLDHKQIAYKLECEIEYVMTFLSKRDEVIRADILTLLHKLCANQDVQNAIMKEHNFHYLVEQSHMNQSEEVRSLCFKIFATISSTTSKQAIKQLFYQASIIKMMIKRLQKDQSEDVICSIILFLQKLTSEDIYLELITQDMDIIQEMLSLLSYRKNNRVRKLAFGILINLLRIDEMRKVVMKWPKLDVLAKLISILQKPSDDKEDLVQALKALTNAIQDYTIMVSFLQQKGHLALAQAFESDDLKIKEICLAIYTSLAQQRPEQPVGTSPLMTVVLDSELIFDVLSLQLNDKKNVAVIRNMLILINTMLIGNNELAIEQFKAFDIISLLLNILTSSNELSYLSLSVLGLLGRLQSFQQIFAQKNKEGSTTSVVLSIITAIFNLKQYPPLLTLLLRSLHIFLTAFPSINGDHLQLDQILTLIQSLRTSYDIVDSTGQYNVVIALKRLSEMDSRQVTLVVNGIEDLAQQLDDAPSINRSHINGIAMDIIEREFARHMKYYESDELENSGINQNVIFYQQQQLQNNASNDVKPQDHLKQELTELKAKEHNMSLYIQDMEAQKKRYEAEIARLASLNSHNQSSQSIQTDAAEEAVQSQDEPTVKQIREQMQMEIRLKKEAEARNEYLISRIEELEQDVVIRDRALQKLTQGTQMAECIGEIKERIREDIKSRFESFKSTIKSLQGVIDTNSKLIKDLTEAVAEKNIQNQALVNEDKLKQGKIAQLQQKNQTFDKQVSDLQSKETQYRMQLQQLLFQEGDKTQKIIDLPSLQLSTEQMIISELQEKLIQAQCSNLQLKSEAHSASNSLKMVTIEKESLESDLQKLKSQLLYDSNPSYVVKSIAKDPKNLDLTLKHLNEALQYLDKTITRHNFKDELCNLYEDRINRLTDRYEQLLLQHSTSLSNYHFCRVQLSQVIQAGQGTTTTQTEMLSQQWQQALSQLKHIEDINRELTQENAQIKLRLQESEEQLAKYRSIVVFDQSQYERLFKLRTELPLTKAEDQVLFFFNHNHEQNEFLRLTKIVDVFLKGISELEYELRKNNTDRLKNDYHLIPEQREAEIREYLMTHQADFKIAKLENHVQLIQEDMNLLDVLSKPGNQTSLIIDEADDLLSRMHQLLSYEAFDQTIVLDTQDTTFARQTTQMKATQSAQNLGANTNVKKKVQTTNLVQSNNGKKPRIANDYDKKIKPQNNEPSKNLDIVQLETLIRELTVKLSSVKVNLNEEQKLHQRYAHDSMAQVTILNESLSYRNKELIEVQNSLQKILLSKFELANHLHFRDFQLASGSQYQGKTQNEGAQKIEGLLKVNNFIRKKDFEVRAQNDLLTHQLDKSSKELLFLSQDNKRLNEQVAYLQRLIQHQRDQFRKGGIINKPVNDEGGEGIPDDDIVKYLVQIDEVNQRNSELEFMLSQALQINIDREKLFRGTEDLIESINSQIETTNAIIGNQVGSTSVKMPAFTGPEAVYERIKCIETNVVKWKEHIIKQMQDIQKKKEEVEALRPENQTLTSLEHQAKLEKYLNIYSARIQTLSSIIASYQKHFKSLEDQLRELQGLPQNPPSSKQIESQRIESLKRMINLKDILIKHQQNEIEFIKKAIIGDKFNELLIYVTAQEKEALTKMRQFDLQVKVVQDYERQCLLTDEEQYKKGEEQLYLKIVNAKIEQDLINIKEMFKVTEQKQEKGGNNGIYQVGQSANSGFKEYFERWLNIVKDMLQSHFDQEKCKGYVSALNQEIPLLVSIINEASNKHSSSNILHEIGLEKDFVNQKFTEMLHQKEELMNQLQETKERCNFLYAKNQQLQEQNILMKKFMHSKKSMSEAFQEFYQEDLLAENAQLKSKILSLTPYNDKLALECATLRTQVSELHEKLLRQDQRSLTEQELFQNLEQTLLDTQKKLLEKDIQLVDFIKTKKDQLFKGSTDKALEVLIQTADQLAKESVQIREINWQLELNYKSCQRQLEEKTAKIKESKQVLKAYETTIKELTIKGEKLNVVSKCGGTLGDLTELKGVSKEKLVYELGGKDGAQYALKFIDTQAAMREEINRLVEDLKNLKMANTTLTILAEDRSAKMHKLTEENKTFKKQLREREDQIERLEFQNQRLQDDFLVQQQSLDVYVAMAISFQNGDRSNTNAFNKCIENAQTLAQLLSNAQRQRGFYFQEAMKNQHENNLIGEQLKCLKHQLNFAQSEHYLQDTQISIQNMQEKVLNGIIGRYDKEIGMISNYVLENNSSKTQSLLFSLQDQLEPEPQSPKKQQKLSAVDSPPHSVKKSQNIKHQDFKLISKSPSLHHFLVCQLQLNEQLSTLSTLQSSLKSLQLSSLLDRAALAYHSDLSTKLAAQCLQWSAQVQKTETDSASLKLQNISLSRWCLYMHRAESFESVSDHEQVGVLLIQEIDKLRIENKLLADRNDALEIKLQHRVKFVEETKGNRIRDQMTERELQQQVEWNQRLQKELMAKSAQIEALSKVHNDFSSGNSAGHNQIDGAEANEQSSVVQNLRNQYAKLQQSLSEVHQKLYLSENRNNQKEKKIELMSERLRELEKKLLQIHTDNLDQNQSQAKYQEKSYASEREMQLQAEIDDIWRKYLELNDLKNALYKRNEDLRIEVDSFKTHFSKYEAQEFKKKIALMSDDSTGMTFQNSLFTELSLMREERDLQSWHLAKLMQRVTLLQSTCDNLDHTVVPQMVHELRMCEDREKALTIEVARAREAQVGIGDSELMLRVSDINRLKRDQVAMRFENARLHRENQRMIKDIQVLKELNQTLVTKEYQIKKKLIDVKNELVKTRVRDDMGEYNSMITGNSAGKSPYKMNSNPSQSQLERVQVYVEDLSVMREQMLKIEFRNIELEETNARVTRELEEQVLRNQEMEHQIRLTMTDETDIASIQQNFYGNIGGELDGRTTEVLDLSRRLIQERWSNQKLQDRIKDQEETIKELNQIQERYMEEVNEHQRLHSEISILKKTIADYQRVQRLQGGDIEDSKDDTLQFYDTQKERFLTQLSLYLTDLQSKSRQLGHAKVQISQLQDQVFSLSAQLESFDQERISYRNLIERIRNDKSHQIEQDFVNTAQYEDGMNKLEALIMNQRKKIAHQKGQIDTLQNEKQIAEHNLKTVRSILTNQERQHLATNIEMSRMKDELVKLRNDRELYQLRISMMWDRLEFQEKVYQQVSIDNVTVEQVVKMYKEQMGKVKALIKGFGGLSIQKDNERKEEEITKGERMKIEAEIVTLKNRDKASQGQINQLIKELDETKLHIRLADMLRKTIGVSHLERMLLDTKIQRKKEKIFKLKSTVAQNSIDRERLADRIDFLERQFNLKAGIPNISSTFVKNNGASEDDQEKIKELEAANAQLRQQIQNLMQGNLKFYESKSTVTGGVANGGTLVSQNSSSTLKSIGGQSRQARAITPLRIRDMPIKQGSIAAHQRIKQNKHNDTVPGENQDFYYGQDVTIDPMSNQSQEETKLPLIGGNNYIQQLDMRLKNNARNMTPLPNRGNSSQYSTLSQPVQVPASAASFHSEVGSVSQALRAAGIVNSQTKGIPRLTANLGKSNQISARQPNVMNPNFETVEQELHSLQNSVSKGEKPQQ